MQKNKRYEAILKNPTFKEVLDSPKYQDFNEKVKEFCKERAGLLKKGKICFALCISSVIPILSLVASVICDSKGVQAIRPWMICSGILCFAAPIMFWAGIHISRRSCAREKDIIAKFSDDAQENIEKASSIEEVNAVKDIAIEAMR